MIKLHIEDKQIMIDFVDYVRLKLKENIELEIRARYVAKVLALSPDVKNSSLCRSFARLLDSKRVV